MAGWFTRLVVAVDVLFASVWMYFVLPILEPVASGKVALHDASVLAAVGLAASSVLIGLGQLWIEPLRLFEERPIVNAAVLFVLAAAVVLAERRWGG
jgi:hypothetical protein